MFKNKNSFSIQFDFDFDFDFDFNFNFVKAPSKSAIISSTSSIPTEKRSKPSLIPCRFLSSEESSASEVFVGESMVDSTPAKLMERGSICNLLKTSPTFTDSIISSTTSSPTEKRSKPSLIPWRFLSSEESSACEVFVGESMVDSTPAKLMEGLIIFNLFKKSPTFTDSIISKESIPV